jgi:hypothetical protein
VLVGDESWELRGVVEPGAASVPVPLAPAQRGIKRSGAQTSAICPPLCANTFVFCPHFCPHSACPARVQLLAAPGLGGQVPLPQYYRPLRIVRGGSPHPPPGGGVRRVCCQGRCLPAAVGNNGGSGDGGLQGPGLGGEMPGVGRTVGPGRAGGLYGIIAWPTVLRLGFAGRCCRLLRAVHGEEGDRLLSYAMPTECRVRCLSGRSSSPDMTEIVRQFKTACRVGILACDWLSEAHNLEASTTERHLPLQLMTRQHSTEPRLRCCPGGLCAPVPCCCRTRRTPT